MVKPTKIDDVKRPGKAAPLPTSRPIVVTNRPMLANDPMVVSLAQGESDEKPKVATVRTARVIKPLSSTLTAERSASEANAAATPETLTEEEREAVSDRAVESDVSPEGSKKADLTPDSSVVTPAEPAPAPKTPVTKSMQSGQSTNSQETLNQSDMQLQRDSEAALTAEEIAAAETQAKRDLELEQLIASGRYHVPINAVQRRRSQMHIVLLSALGLLLALVLVDAVVDAGFIKPPSSIPHTHFFSTTPSGS